MCYSTFLAQVIGLYLFLMSLAALMNLDRCKKITAHFLSDQPLMMFSGAIAMIIGLLIVVTHNVWVSDWPLLITLIGWLALLQGIFRVFFPGAYTRLCQNLEAKLGYVLLNWAWLLIGLYLIWVGFYR